MLTAFPMWNRLRGKRSWQPVEKRPTRRSALHWLHGAVCCRASAVNPFNIRRTREGAVGAHPQF
jgi:hypothetical protein